MIMFTKINKELRDYYDLAKSYLHYNPLSGIFTWRVNRGKSVKKGDHAGCLNLKNYIVLTITKNGKPKQIKAHRLAWYITYGELPSIIDHIDGNPSNNSLDNLRPCTNKQNQMNRGKGTNNTSGYKGVAWHKHKKKWMASIRDNGKKEFLGYYNSPKEASAIYEKRAKELHGDFYHKKEL